MPRFSEYDLLILSRGLLDEIQLIQEAKCAAPMVNLQIVSDRDEEVASAEAFESEDTAK